MYTLGQTVAPAGTTPEYPILASLAPLVQSLAAAYGVVRQSDLNAELIRQGKAPMTAEQMKAFDPRIQLDVGTDTRNIILYGLGGIGILFLLTTLVKSR